MYGVYVWGVCMYVCMYVDRGMYVCMYGVYVWGACMGCMYRVYIRGVFAWSLHTGFCLMCVIYIS